MLCKRISTVRIQSISLFLSTLSGFFSSVWALILPGFGIFTSLFYFLRRKLLGAKRMEDKKKEISLKPLLEKFYGLNKMIDPAGFHYELGQDIFYSVKNGWQRGFGYTRLYDEAAAPLSMIIDCEPIYFDYRGQKWLIEFWKGQYGMTTGAEIGLYVSDWPVINVPGIMNTVFFKSARDEDHLNMKFSLIKNKQILFTRNARHWWLTGFVLGEFTRKPTELTMNIELTFRSRMMMLSFLDGLSKAGYTEDEVNVSNMTVYITFNKPHTKQPLSRSRLLTYITQKRNKRLCKYYRRVTKGLNTTIDRLEFIQWLSPKRFERMMNIGKPKQLYTKLNQKSA